MDEPRRTRLILSLGAVIAVLLLVVAVQFGAPHKAAPPQPPPPPQPAPAAAPAPPAPVPAAPPTLRRADLIAAVAEAASAFAEGRLPEDDRGLSPGRRFQLVIPFNCRGQADSPASYPATAKVDAKRRTVTLSAAPEQWSGEPWLKTILGEPAAEAVEGFWVPRPWILGEVCPAVPVPQAAEPPDLPAPTLGLMQAFYADGSRVGQRGSRPYRVVRKLTEEQAAGGLDSYRLVLAGRIAALIDNRAVRCFSASVDVQPTCIVGVEIDKVRFEDAAGAETLAEWSE